MQRFYHHHCQQHGAWLFGVWLGLVVVLVSPVTAQRSSWYPPGAQPGVADVEAAYTRQDRAPFHHMTRV